MQQDWLHNHFDIWLALNFSPYVRNSVKTHFVLP